MLYLCICVFVFVYLCMRHLVISVLTSLDQELSENIWFVWSETYFGENVGCHARPRTDDGQRNVKIELEFWKQNSQSAKVLHTHLSMERSHIRNIKRQLTKLTLLLKCMGWCSVFELIVNAKNLPGKIFVN